jgi:hypothetical protein
MHETDYSAEIEASDLTSVDSSTLRSFFHPECYARIQTDVAEAQVDLFGHFIADGFAEGRIPSHAVLRESLEFIVSDKDSWLAVVPDTLAGLADLLRNWPLDSIFGPAPLVCPEWLSKQPSLTECESLADILQTSITKGPFELHPGLLPVDVASPMTVLDLIEDIYAKGEISRLSSIDLQEYAKNHRDLAHFKTNPNGAFQHLWTLGSTENRLKYAGNRRLRSFSPRESFVAQIQTVYRLRLSRSSLTTPRNSTGLAPFNLRLLDAHSDISKGLKFVLEQAVTNECFDSALDYIMAIGPVFNDLKTYVLADEEMECDDVPKVRVGSTALTDQDLMSGAHKVTTRRVVYGVNIGNYDDLPVPPNLDDCSYFLITDAAKIPQGSPWTVVRPTIREVDVKRQCLWYKTHPHWMFPDAEFVTWIDSNVTCLTHSEEILKSHETLSEVATFTHPDRDCVFEEAVAITKLQLDRADVIKRVTGQMRDAGFPQHAGFYETNVLFSRTQDLCVRDFFDTWWRNIYLGSRRDQMSFTYSAWQTGVEISALDARFSAKDSRFFSKTQHKSKKGRFV